MAFCYSLNIFTNILDSFLSGFNSSGNVFGSSGGGLFGKTGTTTATGFGTTTNTTNTGTFGFNSNNTATNNLFGTNTKPFGGQLFFNPF